MFPLLASVCRLAYVTTALLWCCGCHSGRSNIIYVIPQQSSQSMWVSEHVGASDAALRSGARIYWNGPTEDGDVEQQVDLAERAIANGSLGLVLSPVNPFALNTVVERSLRAHIPVVILGSPLSLKPQEGLSFVLNDEKQMGLLAADRIRTVLRGRGEVLLLGVSPFSFALADRSTSFSSAISRTAPEIHVIEIAEGRFSFGQAELAAEKAILAHPNLSAIMSLNAAATRGAIAATRATHTSDRVTIVGCDYDLDLLFLLRKKALDSLVAPNMRMMGATAVEYVMKEHRGETIPDYTFAAPTVITRENIDDPDIQHLLYMDWRGQ
jgi:ribose transport system substrate-binding protein